MATKTSRPGRTLLIFVLAIIAMYAGVAAIGTWKPKLGLDLQGGQRITLQAKSVGGGGITKDKLNEAVGIINSRVNGAGVSEAQVSTQGQDIIIVEIPGKSDDNLARSIGDTAQLRFRLVAGQPLPPQGTPVPTAPTAPTGTVPTQGGPSSGGPSSGGPSSGGASGATQGAPSSGATQGSATQGSATQGSPTQGSATQGSPTSTGKNRPAPAWIGAISKPAAAPTSLAPTGPAATTQQSSPSTTGPDPTSPSNTGPTDSAGTQATGAAVTPTEPAPTGATSGGPPPALVPPQLETIQDPYAWTQSPPQSWQARLAAYDCTRDPSQPGQADIPNQPLLACDQQGNRFLLGPSMVDGTDVTNASAGIPQGGIEYVVDLQFNGDGAKKFGAVTTRIAGTGQQFAIVLDGQVESAPTNDQPITGGQAQISGSSTNPFTQAEADSLANSLKYGALPLSFETVNSSQEGPELAANQLSAGILAGIIGLILVVIYCVLYYRALSVVIVTSLLIAGVITYAMVLLLGHAYGFTLTLPGIAGLIVAVGITADSFIVYFERLRDEVRDGRTLRTSVETGWSRARTTILAADAVSLLAAVVLFIFAIGVVKGFAFALGLSTLIDVFVVFFFTKPMVTYLSRTRFFGQGHKWSGLDRQHLGMPPLKRIPRTVGGQA